MGKRSAVPFQGARIDRRESAVAHITGLVLTFGGLGMLVSAVVGALYDSPESIELAGSAFLIGVPALILWRATRTPARLPLASIFAAVFASWVALSLASVLPYLWTGTFDRFDDALFESISGFTTTGATLLDPIEGLGEGILFWRALTQWLGGMGVIVLAVAVLPFLGVGGLDLLRAEAPGPSSERLVPRVRETARRLWILYVGLTIAVAVAYAIAGMSTYEAVTHTFTTVSTGGFSIYDDSLAHFGSGAVEWIAIAAMFLAAGNFAFYWRALRGKPAVVFRSVEFRAYALVVAGICAFAVAWAVTQEGATHDTVRQTIFSVVAVISTTGYTVTDWMTWATAPQLVLLFGMALGGMTGSTAGGFKVFRLLAILAHARAQIVRQLHPRAITVVRIGHDVVPEDVMGRVLGFFGLFMAVGAVGTLAAGMSGADWVTAISAGATSIGNVGPGHGEIGPAAGTFHAIAAPARAVLMVVMLVGRLEIFPVILGFVAATRTVEQRRYRPQWPHSGRR